MEWPDNRPDAHALSGLDGRFRPVTGQGAAASATGNAPASSGGATTGGAVGGTAPFGTVGTAMVTCFADDGGLDLDATASVAAHLLDTGHDLLVVNGTTGESVTTSDAEKASVLRVALEVATGRAVVLAGVGTADTAHSIELALAAAAAGADGLLVNTPYYNKPPQSGLLAHFTAIADATDLPVMLYDIPSRAGVAIATDTLLRLADHPRIVAVKDAKGDLAGTTAVLAAGGLAYYSGNDELNLALLAVGAVGVVSVVGHVAGRCYREMVDAVAAGDLPTARRTDRRLAPAVRAIMTRTQGAIMAKAALQLIGVVPGRTMRLPLLAATDIELAELAADLRVAGLLGAGPVGAGPSTPVSTRPGAAA